MDTTEETFFLSKVWKLFTLFLKCFNSLFSYTALCFLIVTLLSFSDALAQSVQVSGKISDEQTGQAIYGAEVHLEELNQSVLTDIDGRFIIRNIPAGEYQLIVQSIGYQQISVPIRVRSGESVNESIELERIAGEGDKIYVLEHRNRKARAFTRQQQPGHFNSVLSSSEIDYFGDYSVQSAVRRVPGIQASRDGQINIRGVGIDQYYVTIDGQRMASTGSGDRSVDLGAISTDIIREIEVNKVIRPDMDADGLAGAVNLVTRRPAGGEREISLQMGGGANTGYFSRTGPSSRFSVHYSEPLQDNLTLVVGLQREAEQTGWESLGMVYDVADFGNGLVDVLESVSPGVQTDERGRWGGRVQLNYEPDDRTRYHVRGLLTSENRERVGHNDTWKANGDWIDQSSTGETGNLGSHGHNARLQEYDTNLYNFQAGATHIFGQFDLNYNLEWSRSSVNRNEYFFPFMLDGLNHSIDMQDRERPKMEVTNFRLQEDGSIDRQFLFAQDFNRILNEQIDNIYAARVDLKIPLGIADIQVGYKAQISSKQGDFREASLDLARTFRLVRFNVLPEPDRSLDLFSSNYMVPWLLNTADAKAFVESQIPTFRRDENQFHRDSDIYNYDATERLLAGYGMANMNIGRVSILAGIRAEYLDAAYEGRTSEFDDSGDFTGNEDVSDERNQLDLFPHASFTLNLGSRNNLMLAYSRTIARPEFNQLVPFHLIDAQSLTSFRGNPNLEPVRSNNLDLYFERYFDHVGLISAGVFAKQLEDFIFIEQQTIGSGDLAGYTERTFQNGSQTATVYGVELSLDKSLSFLPGFLGNFGTYANYTWTQSTYETDRDDVELPGQSPHVVNVALDYNQGRIGTRLAYHWTATSLFNLRDEQSMAPAISSSQNVYLDSYRDGMSNLSFSFRFRISDQFRFWANTSNLISDDRYQYLNTRELYPENIQRFNGREIMIGILYNL